MKAHCSPCVLFAASRLGPRALLTLGVAAILLPASAIQAEEALPESWVNPPPPRDEPLTQHVFEESPRAPLISMGEGGRLVYRAFSDRGDRLLDWSTVGYMNSEVPLPTVPAKVTLAPLVASVDTEAGMAYPLGPDSRERIQAALDKVGAMEADSLGIRGAVHLTRGIYYINGHLRIPSGVVLRGEGSGLGGTTLIGRSRNDREAMVYLGERRARIENVGLDDAVRIADPYVPTGADHLSVKDASQFAVGDFVSVRKTTNDAWIEAIGMGQRLRHIRGGEQGAFKRPWSASAYQLNHIRQITAIDGNEIAFNTALPQSIAEEHGGGMVYKVDMSSLGTQSGIEGIALVSNYNTEAPPGRRGADFRNYRNGVQVEGTKHSWVRDVTVLHVSFAAVTLQNHTQSITVRDSKNLEPVGGYHGGLRYAFNIGGGGLHLFYNCYSEDGRHDFATGARNQGPFAFVRCTAVRGGQSEPHHRWTTGVLFDRVVTRDGSLAAINRGDSGTGHGWAGANALMWNCDARNIVVFNPETDGENNFAIGFIGDAARDHGTRSLWYANTRAGFWETPQEGKYFGYAVMGSGHIESPDGPVEPESLFEQQLIDRIGETRAMAVLQ